MSKPDKEPVKVDTLAAAREIFSMGMRMLRECRDDVHYWEKLAPGVNGALANLLQAEAQAKTGGADGQP